MARWSSVEESGPSTTAGPLIEVQRMTAHIRGINITSFLGPFAVVGMMFGTWAVLGFLESCIPQWADPARHCEHSAQFYLIFAGGVAVLAGVMAWVTRLIYHPIRLFPTKTSELLSALLASFVMGIVSYGLIRWEWYFPDIAGQLYGWLGVGLLALGILLIIVNYFSGGNKKS